MFQAVSRSVHQTEMDTWLSRNSRIPQLQQSHNRELSAAAWNKVKLNKYWINQVATMLLRYNVAILRITWLIMTKTTNSMFRIMHPIRTVSTISINTLYSSPIRFKTYTIYKIWCRYHVLATSLKTMELHPLGFKTHHNTILHRKLKVIPYKDNTNINKETYIKISKWLMCHLAIPLAFKKKLKLACSNKCIVHMHNIQSQDKLSRILAKLFIIFNQPRPIKIFRNDNNHPCMK